MGAVCAVSPAEAKAVAQGARSEPSSASWVYSSAGKAPVPGSPAPWAGISVSLKIAKKSCMAGRDVGVAFEENGHTPANKAAWVLSPNTK